MSCPNGTLSVEGIPLQFQTYSLYSILQEIYNICANDTRLIVGVFGPELTKQAAINITGNSGGVIIFRDWSPYLTSLILKRFITWKIPLFQLLMQFSQPPYKYKMKFFAIFHVMGDPIDTIASLMFTLSVSKKRLHSLANDMKIMDRSALVLIITSYEECGSNKADRLEHEFVNNDSSFEPTSLESTFITTAHALAADRATKLLPVLSAVGLLFATIAVSFFKIKSSSWTSTEPWHIDLHCLASSLTLTWVVPAVLLSAVVGVPQSQFSSKRILCQFEALRGWRTNVNEILSEVLEEPKWTSQLENGGIPSWRFDRWSWTCQSKSVARQATTKHTWARDLVGLLVVAIGSTGAAILSNFVPPDGFNCRAKCEVVILSLYISSYMIGVLLARCHIKTEILFWISMVKNILFTLSMAAVILIAQTGILNRIDCYVCEKGTVLCLPDQTKDIVSLRMHNIYPEIIFGIFTSQLFVWVILALFYIDSLAVFLQQDDGRNNLITRMVGFKLALLRILRLGLPGARPRVMAEEYRLQQRLTRDELGERLIVSSWPASPD